MTGRDAIPALLNSFGAGWTNRVWLKRHELERVQVGVAQGESQPYGASLEGPNIAPAFPSHRVTDRVTEDLRAIIQRVTLDGLAVRLQKLDADPRGFGGLEVDRQIAAWQCAFTGKLL